MLPYGILINTDLVKPADEPKSWQDLLDPKWKGKIVMFDPTISGNTSTHLEKSNSFATTVSTVPLR